MDQEFGAVCSITRNDGSGQGVFISPRRVLTCWHVVKGARSLTFTNSNGVSTSMKPAQEGGMHLCDRELDLAVVELQQPIGLDIALPPTGRIHPEDIFKGASGVLKTHFGGKAAIYPVSYPVFSDMRVKSGEDIYSVFSSAVKVIPGYSGSPVFAKDGMTLLSIVAAIQPAEQLSAENFKNFFSDLYGKSGSTPQIYIPFLAIDPHRFADWYKAMEKELDI